MIGRLVRLSRSDRALIVRVIPLVALVRWSLWILPFARVQGLLASHHWSWAIPARVVNAVPVSRLEWAVRSASRRVPAATCLTQSLALQYLLARSGRAATLRIGVTVTGGRGFEAHAWVECDGRELLDRPETLARFTPLASWES